MTRASCIVTPRLALVVLDRAFLDCVQARRPRPDLGFDDPHGFLDGADDVVRLRIAQLVAAPARAPWLLRAVVLRERRAAIGFLNFHAAPDAARRVEIGYEILPAFRRCGYATEAVTAMAAWAARQGARILRACVQPTNTASLAMIERGGYTLVGEQRDDVDGRELVFEKPIAP
jgi:RimJ/RimL family protein N-acetyltransferase